MKRRKMAGKRKPDTQKNAGYMPPAKNVERGKKIREKRLEGKSL